MVVDVGDVYKDVDVDEDVDGLDVVDVDVVLETIDVLVAAGVGEADKNTPDEGREAEAADNVAVWPKTVFCGGVAVAVTYTGSVRIVVGESCVDVDVTAVLTVVVVVRKTESRCSNGTRAVLMPLGINIVLACQDETA